MRLLPAGAPRLGLGLAALGRPGYITLNRGADLADRSVEAMRARAEEVLDAAYAGGVRWFDCARSYGLSEDFVGKWLEKRGHGSDAVAVSSKWGYRYTAGWRVDTGGEPHEVKDHSAAHLRQQWPESDDLVGSHLRLYQVHSATFDSGILDNVETHEALAALKRDRGWALGLSVSSPAQGHVVDAALKIEVDGERLFDAVQATYNVFEQAPGPSLTAAHAQGCTIIVKEAMANGRVLSNAALLKHAAELDCSPDALALAVVLAQPFEPHVLSGRGDDRPDRVKPGGAARPAERYGRGPGSSRGASWAERGGDSRGVLGGAPAALRGTARGGVTRRRPRLSRAEIGSGGLRLFGGRVRRSGLFSFSPSGALWPCITAFSHIRARTHYIADPACCR